MKMKLSAVALAALLFAGLPPTSSSAYVGISVGFAPPAIPIYQQPYCPAPGYIWTPGYWAYANFGYYWVPGAWVLPPRIGFLWTPGYWGYNGGRYVFNQGYWGPTVGFYGGINYGYGYGGRGYYGGQWSGNTFRYNTAVTRVNTNVIHTTYVNREVVNKNTTGTRASFNGPGGVKAKPTSREQAATKAQRIPPTTAQRSRVEAAKKDPALHAANNHGKPKPEAIKEFHGKNRVQPAAAGAAAGTKGGKQAGVGKNAGTARQTGATKQAGAVKATGKNAKATDHSQGTARTKGTKKAPSTQANRNGQAKKRTTNAPHTAQTRKTTGAPHTPKRTYAAPKHSAKPASAKRTVPAAHKQRPVENPQDAKKKKKGEKKHGGQ